ncbi:MAG: iron-sulfur cluster assembly accessory protein [Gemmatimonadetes bacterium]|nr:iron-sulfur cluster assembly accessory protein [Gemmatimonadota bacterium]
MSNSSQLNIVTSDFTLTITDGAAKRVRDVIKGGLPETAGLRVGVVAGGCSGLTYDVTIAEGPHSADMILKINNTRVFVDKSSAQYINGMIVDWISSMQESRFVFQNPNETGNCGCGISFSV